MPNPVYQAVDRISKWTLYRLLLPLVRFIMVGGLIIGIFYTNQCPAAGYLPVLLIVAGSLSLIANLMELSYDCWKENNCYCKALIYIINGILILLYVASTVATLKIYRPEYWHESSSRYCNVIVYLYSFFMISAVAVLTAVHLIIKFLALEED